MFFICKFVSLRYKKVINANVSYYHRNLPICRFRKADTGSYQLYQTQTSASRTPFFTCKSHFIESLNYCALSDFSCCVCEVVKTQPHVAIHASSFALSVPWSKVKSSICRTTFVKYCGASCATCGLRSVFQLDHERKRTFLNLILFPYSVTLLRLFPYFLNANVHQSNSNQEMSPIIKYNCLAFNSNKYLLTIIR